MRIAILGSNSFIGRYLYAHHISNGDKVDGFDRYETELALHQNKIYDRVYFLYTYGNLYHQEKNKLLTTEINVSLLTRALALINYRLFIHFSTSSTTLPVQTDYSLTKRAGESIVQMFDNAISVRPYSVYGFGDNDKHFIPTIYRKLRDGETIDLAPGHHDWIHVSDLVDAVTHIEDLPDGPVGLGTGVSTSNSKVLDVMASLMNKTPKINKVDYMREYDTRDWFCDEESLSFLKSQGYKQKFDLIEGLSDTYRQLVAAENN